MKPKLIVKRSAWSVLNFWLVLTSIFIIPLIIQICKIIQAKCDVIEFYDNRMVHKKGVFNKLEDQNIFVGVYSVSVYQTFWGRILGYGDLVVDCPGEWDINQRGIKHPKRVKRFLESRISKDGMTNIIHN